MHGQEPRDAAIIVGKRVDREKIEDQSGDQDKGVRAAFPPNLVVADKELSQQKLDAIIELITG